MGLRFEALRRVRGGNELWWRYGASGLAAWSHLVGSTAVDEEVVAVVEQVIRHGVATTHVDRLFRDGEAFAALAAEVDGLVAGSEELLAAARRDPDDVWQVSLTGERPTLSAADPIVRFLLSPEVSAVASHYYRMPVRLLECKVRQTVSADAAPVTTQRWHRDRPGDGHLLKCFVYLNDVDERSGPFCFAPGTHRGGAVTPTRSAELEGKVERFADDGVEAELAVVACTGPAGTVVFADTTGLHMGGRAAGGERLVVVAQFASAAAWQRPYFDVAGASGDRATDYALGLARPPRARHLRRHRAAAAGSAARRAA